MNRKPSFLRRSLAVAGAAFVGLAADVRPGLARERPPPVVTGDYKCVDGGWEVTWTVTNSENDLEGKLTSDVGYTPRTRVRRSRRTRSLPQSVEGNLVEKLTLPADAKGASL